MDRNEEETSSTGQWASALLAILGGWLLLEALLFDLVLAQRINDFLIGILLFGVGGYNYYRRANDGERSTAAAALAALVGLWLIVAPWIIGVDVAGEQVAEDLAFWNDIVVGALVFVLGLYSAFMVGRDHGSRERLASDR